MVLVGEFKMKYVCDESNLFKVHKPIIGVVHLPPLPGAPRHYLPMKDIVEMALKDARSLQEGGVDGILLENFGDAPYYPDRVKPITVAAMSFIAANIVKAIDIPLGINVLRNDAVSALSIAYIVGGKFIRVNVLTEAMITDQGIIQGKAYEVLRLKKILNSDVKIFADVHVKHATPIVNKSIESSARDLVLRGLADAVIVTGEATGAQADMEKVLRVKRAIPETPVFVGSGVNKDNISHYLKVCDGVIVGTSLKVDGRIENPVDVNRVKELVSRANEVRLCM